MPTGLTERRVLVFEGASSKPYRADDLAAARAMLEAGSERWCAVIEYSRSRAEGTGQTPAFEVDLHDRFTELGVVLLESLSPDVSPLDTAVFTRNHDEGWVLGACSSERLIYLRLERPVPRDGEPDQDAVDAEFEFVISDIVAARADEKQSLGQIAAAVRSAREEATLRWLAQQLRELSARAASVVMATAVDVRALIVDILKTRQLLRELAVQATGRSEKLLFRLEEAVRDIDALTQILNATLLQETVDINAQTSALERERRDTQLQTEQQAAQVRTEREHRLTKYAVALVLPTIWVTYWSSKPAPELHGALGNLVVWGGAVLVGALGYLGAKLLYGRVR